MTPARRLLPLVLATTATQASIVVLAPIVVEIGRHLDASVSAVGQARSILAATAVVTALRIGPAIDRFGVRPLIVSGGALGALGAGVTAAAPSLPLFYAAHIITGTAVACLLTAGFAGVASYFPQARAPWAIGYVVAAQSLAWILGNPLIGLLTDAVSWRLAYAVPGVACLLALSAAMFAPRAVARSDRPRSEGILSVLQAAPARRWALSELVAYSAWTAELTYVGAFYVHTYHLEESVVGVLLAVGSLAFLVSTLNTARITARFRRRAVVVTGALGMGALVALIMNVTPSVAFTLATFCLMALFAGMRTTSSSALGLDLLPAQPGTMMAARTASAQFGYAVGALAGGAVLAVADFSTLGFVLLTGMCLAAVLVWRVDDPLELPLPLAAQPLPEATAR